SKTPTRRRKRSGRGWRGSSAVAPVTRTSSGPCSMRPHAWRKKKAGGRPPPAVTVEQRGDADDAERVWHTAEAAGGSPPDHRTGELHRRHPTAGHGAHG